MKLRIAKKIIELSTGDDGNPTNRYTENQLQRAVNRYKRCRTSKETDKFFDDIFAYRKLMNGLREEIDTILPSLS